MSNYRRIIHTVSLTLLALIKAFLLREVLETRDSIFVVYLEIMKYTYVLGLCAGIFNALQQSDLTMDKAQAFIHCFYFGNEFP